MEFDEMMARFALVKFAGKPRVMELDATGKIVEFYDFQDFKNYFIRETVSFTGGDGKVKSVKMTQHWLEHTQSKRYEGLCYHMPGSEWPMPANWYNGYRGFTVESKPGAWDRNKNHIWEVICNGNDTHFVWVMNWLAALFQRPGAHGWASIVMRGGQGIGKGHFAHEMIGRCFYDQQYIHIIGANQLTAEFNEHLSGKVLVFADESTWGGDPRAASKLKGLITEANIPINRKFLPMVAERSALHILIASNNDWPIPIEKDDRRFCVLDVPDTYKQNSAYFGPLLEELRNGGREAMIAELLSMPIDDDALRHPPGSKSKHDISIRSLKPSERWWFEVLESGELQDGKWPYRISKREMHDLYTMFLDRHYRGHSQMIHTEMELGRFLKRYILKEEQITRNGKRERFLILPKLEDARAMWQDNFGWPDSTHEWEAELQQMRLAEADEEGDFSDEETM